jgi:3-methyladenine DNA glycosylase/8-oxoguanine DNA glycosylase
VVERIVKPAGPYSLALSARSASDATRWFRDGVLTAVVGVGEGARAGLALQAADGRVHLRADDTESIERLRFVLALDDDHSAFLRRFARDPLLGRTVGLLAGMRPLRVGTVAHALLRALCGQLIEASTARAIERKIIRETTLPVGLLHEPPTAERLGELSPAKLRALGLHARRSATLVRVCRSLDLERLRALPTDVVAARLERERGLGAWSVGVICLEGLGRVERGLVGDLGLVKLASALRGRWVDTWETEELLEPYGEWAGLASVYLLAGYARGLVPLRAAGSTWPPRSAAA